MKVFTESWLGCNFALNFTSYLSIAISKILPHSKTIKNAKKLSVFGKKNSPGLSTFLQKHIFRMSDHISKTDNQINHGNISFPKVIIILIITTQMLFPMFFPKKDPHLNAVEYDHFKMIILK